jgi:nitrogen regulatory protein P-II 1
MKEIRAVIRPQKLGRLREVLRAVPDFPGMTISRAQGCGASVRHVPHNVKEELVDFTDKVRVEIIAPDELVDALVDSIVQVAATGLTGDGLVWVVEVERAVFVRKVMGGGNPPA